MPHKGAMKKVRQLLNVVAVAHAVVAEDVAVVPEFLNDGGASHSKRVFPR